MLRLLRPLSALAACAAFVLLPACGDDGGPGGLCGDGFVDPGEECDDSGDSVTCDADCTFAECGDEYVNVVIGEQCDALAETTLCDADCTHAGCGDGELNPTAGEQCDDGNEFAGDGCSSLCVLEECGNGILDPGEACDDAGESADCDANCTLVLCGDLTINATAGEQCDEGGLTATCNADCTMPVCGDGELDVLTGEACDDGGESLTCDVDCTPAYCGDGTNNATRGETCDDGGGESATCDADCTDAMCGDGTINATAGEECDVGSSGTPGCVSCLWVNAPQVLEVTAACDLLGMFDFDVTLSVTLVPGTSVTSGGTFTLHAASPEIVLGQGLSDVVILGGGAGAAVTLTAASIELSVGGTTAPALPVSRSDVPMVLSFDADSNGIGEEVVVPLDSGAVERTNDGSMSIDISLTSLHLMLEDVPFLMSVALDVPTVSMGAEVQCTLPMVSPTVGFPVE